MEALELVREHLKAGGHLGRLQTFACRICAWERSHIADYMVEHRCTEWELERALFQYLKSIASSIFSSNSSA